jgi:putative tricarboxylic transport membrane protein
MAALGFTLGTVGIDNLTGTDRFTFGTMVLFKGVGLVPMLMGLFGIAEVFSNLEQPIKREIFKTEIGRLLPSMKDWAESKWAIVRGCLIGFFLGLLPGGGATISSITAYAVEKRFSKTPEKFGTGMIAGVASPEAANNSATGGAFIPLLALGIPGTAAMAVITGALIIHGIQPGPLLIQDHPNIFWGVVTSMYIGNGMLLILNLPLIGLWVRILKIPYSILFALILLFCLIGAYSLNNDTGDVVIMIIFGVVGYLMRKYEYEAPPMVLAFILGPKTELSLRRSLLLSDGSPFIFFQRPISLGLILVAILLIVFSVISVLKKKRLQPSPDALT